MLTEDPEQTLISQLFDAQPDSVVWFVPVFAPGDTETPVDFEVRYCNLRAALVLGSTPEHVIGMRVLDTNLLDDPTRERILEQCLLVWNSNKAIEFNYYSTHRKRHFNVQRSKIHGGILSVTRDRTELVQAEQDRRKQEERFRDILDTAADGILVFESIRDSAGNIVDFKIAHANRRSYEIGALPSTTVGSSLLNLLPHLRGSEQFEWHRHVVETGQPYRFETSFRQPDGSEYGWFIVSLTKLDDGLVSNFVDVTLSKRNERKIHDQNYLLTRIFESSINGMYAASAVRNPEGRVIDFRIDMINRAYTQLVGLTEEQTVGKTFLTLFPGARQNGAFDLLVRVVDQRQAERDEMPYRDEKINAWYDLAASPLEPDGILVAFTDITNRKLLQIQLEEKIDELKRSNQSLEEFAYAASHDLQEPLRKIHFFADRLKATLEPGSERADMFARMESATARMRDLIDDLLSYSRLNVVPESFVDLSLSEIVQKVLQDLERSVEESGARIDVDPLPVVRADERQMRQLFQNLLSNALKYRTPERSPVISVRYRICTDKDLETFHLPHESSGYFLVEVTDNGIGFEQQYADKIFQVFQRLHGRREYEGSGVGLAIARKVVINHRGVLTAEGHPGEGATFRVFLPLSMLVQKKQ
ncbi:sensor histidine kinase [Flaviaesturariibacter terrae]